MSAVAGLGASAAADPLAALPATVRRRLDEMKAGVELALGPELYALLVYGSAARGAYKEGQSNVDVALVVRDGGRDRLSAIANVLRLARASARIEAMILQFDEIAGAADVFPLLYDDLRAHHVLLSGEDPFEHIAIDDKHRRLRVEQELRDAQVRLRRLVVDGGGNPTPMGLSRRLEQLRAPLHALLKLRGTDWPDTLEGVLAGCARAYGIDLRAVGRLREDPRGACDALLRLLREAVTDVDRRADERWP